MSTNKKNWENKMFILSFYNKTFTISPFRLSLKKPEQYIIIYIADNKFPTEIWVYDFSWKITQYL